MEIQDVEENVGDDKLFGLDDINSDEPEITEHSRPKRTYPIRREKPENIPVPDNTVHIPRKRGRPAKSTSVKSTTQVEGLWVAGTEILLGIGTAAMAAQIFNNPKYRMTKVEAESAAKGIVYILFQYKQIREFATLVNPNSNYYVLAKAFWPYVNRVFMKEMLDNVISGFFVSRPGERKSAVGNKSAAGQSNSKSDATVTSHNDGYAGNPTTSRIVDWRDVG